MQSVTLSGNSGEKIAGKGAVTGGYGKDPVIVMDEANASESITIDCGEGVTLGSTAETATAFWFVIPPTTFEKGFTITATTVDGWSMSRSTSAKRTIQRNVMNKMSPLKAAFDTKEGYAIYYTSTDGEVVTPSNPDAFGATIISNTYENGKGVIKFDGEIEEIGRDAYRERRILGGK